MTQTAIMNKDNTSVILLDPNEVAGGVAKASAADTGADVLDEKILLNNLNDVVSYEEFFRAFGYTENDRIYLRSFNDKKRDNAGRNMDVLLYCFDAIVPELRKRNANDNGIFFVVNGGGQNDQEVKKGKLARAQFIDFDDFPFNEQLRRLREFPLEPSIIVKTQKSLHPYWLLKNGEIKYFREIQERLIQYFGSDSVIKNESRVMRLYGFEHRKKDQPVLVTLIKFNPELRHTQRQLHEALQRLKPEVKSRIISRPVEEPGRGEGDPAPGEKPVKHGSRHHYLVKRIGYYVQTIGDTADDEMIFSLLCADFRQNCENDDGIDYAHLRAHYFDEITKTREKFAEDKEDPNFFKYARLAWIHEHPAETFDPDQIGWNEVEAAGHRAKAEGLVFTPGKAVKELPEDMVSDNDPLTEEQAVELSRSQELNLARSKAGKVLSVPENYFYILSNDPYLRGKIRYNQLDGRIYCSGFWWNLEEHTIRDVDLTNIRKFISTIYHVKHKDEIIDSVYAVGDANAFHPVRDELNSLVWDGAERLPELFPKYLGAERSGYTTAVTKLLFYGLITRVFHPGTKFDTAVVLADTKQGTGKSTICRLLALRDEWYTDTLDDLNDSKRAFEALRGHIVVELGEMLATRRAKDIESIKGYLSRTADDYRIPHSKFAERYPRQAVFIGTTNKSQFLPDDRTGNRRFIPLLCDGSKQEVHPMHDLGETREYVRQCFAEAMITGKQENFPLLIPEEYQKELAKLQQISAPEDEKAGIIQEYLDKKQPQFVCTRMIFDNALPTMSHPNRWDNRRPEKWELQEIGEIMNTQILGYRKYMGVMGRGSKDIKKRFDDYGFQRAWVREDVPESVPENVPEGENNVPEGTGIEGFLSLPEEEPTAFDEKS